MNLTDRQYGFNIFTIPIEDVLKYSVIHGLNHIEINLTRSHSSPASFDDVRIDSIRRFSEVNGIALSFHLPISVDVSDIIPSLRRKHTRYLIRSIELAGNLGVSHITMHMGTFFWFPVERWMRRRALDRFIRSMGDILVHCEKHDVHLALENAVPIPHGSEYFFLGDRIPDFFYLHSKLQSKYLRFCLDTGHANLAEGVIPYIDAFGDKLITLHYHDNLGKNDDHLPIGEGNIDWVEVTAALDNLGYTRPFISECRHLKPHVSAQALHCMFNTAVK